MGLDKNQKLMFLGGVLIIATTLIIPLVYSIIILPSMIMPGSGCHALTDVFMAITYSLFNLILFCTGLIIGVIIIILSIFATQKRRKYITMLKFVKYLPFVVLLTGIFLYFALPSLMNSIFGPTGVTSSGKLVYMTTLPPGTSFWSYNPENPYDCGPTTFASNPYMVFITLFMYIIAAVIIFISSNKSIKQASKI